MGAVVVAALLVEGCGDSNGGAKSALTIPPTTVASTSTTSTTTIAPTTTRSTPSTTAVPATTSGPTTTRARASDATAEAFFEGWVANDSAKLAANGESGALAQATLLATSRSRPWIYDRCEGAAGSIYCSWIDGAERLIIRVRNVEPPPRAVVEIRIEAV